MKDLLINKIVIFGLLITMKVVLMPRAVVGSISCNKESVHYCYSNLGNSSLLTQAIPYASDEVLEEFCRKYDSFSTCYTPVRNKCLNDLPLMMVAQLEGDFHSHRFQCYEGAEDYAKSKKCFSNTDLQRDTGQCIQTLNIQLKAAVKETDTIGMTEKLCQAGSIYIGCVNNYVDVICKDKVALEWIKTFNVKSLHPLYSAFVCPGFEPISTTTPEIGSPATPIVLGVLLGLFCIVIVIAIVLLVYFCIRNKYYHNISCLNSLVERFRNQPPPYHPPLNALQMRANNKNREQCQSSAENNLSNTLPIEGSYFEEPIFTQNNQLSRDSYVERYVKDVYNQKQHVPPYESPSKTSGMQISAAFKQKFADSGSKGMTTVASKDSAVSCTSSPSTHFEPPTCNPFTKSLSPSSSNLEDLPEKDITIDYYC